MAHHRDPNAPISLNTATRESEEIALINAEIVLLTGQISGKPKDYLELDTKRTKLYSPQIIWDASYDTYIAGNEFEEHNKTYIFEILEKYIL
ncbi:hypothetical protein N7449_009293 [Penicillium cf. viridicatum]|uniref:Uncharacterized protein n=1 Tax=Penicillium cf. viridicatum TaxID=2972119 RepID=A0A9W9M7X3_9EURO|nr:hypothetical protein N7449_009293 [Penicillium cf. viridicatum]